MKVGFIGLGHMGAGMAANLLRAGHEVTVYNRTPGKERALVEQGAHAAGQVADACQGEAVMTMLADDGAVEGVVFGDQGVIGSLGPGAIHLSMSTISVALSDRITGAHAKAGQRFVAAPVFGRPDVAAAGKLFIVAAGAPDAVTDCSPLFEALGQKTFSVGDEPQAHATLKPRPIPEAGPLARPKSVRAARPADNPQSPEKIALGQKPFFDGRLSADGSVACSTCHDPVRA